MLMKAGTENLRKQNRRLILSTLRRLGAVSHTEVAQWSGLSSATVSTITGELEKEGIILRVERGIQLGREQGRGRPRVMLQQNPQCAYVATVRITSELVQYSLVDFAGILKDQFEEKYFRDDLDMEKFSHRFKAGLLRLTERNNLSPERILMISIAIKGLVARGKPQLLWSAVFGDKVINFETLLQPDWTGKILLTNDTQFAAQGILAQGVRKQGGFKSGKLATISLGHSIGLGIACEKTNGEISSLAPPFGHMMHDPNGPLCICGAYGCIESLAGFYGILRHAFEVDRHVVPTRFIPLKEIEHIAELARNGDHRSEYAFRMAGEALGIGIGRLLTLLGPMPIAMTGRGMVFFDLMEEAISSGIQNNLQMRYDRIPDITFHHDESQLIFSGNVQACLSDLDGNIMSQTKWNKVEV